MLAVLLGLLVPLTASAQDRRPPPAAAAQPRTSSPGLAVGQPKPAVPAVAVTPASAEREKLKQQYLRPEDIPFPPDDPYSPAKAELGRTLFFDPIFSGSGQQSCASCHNPSLSWGDGLPRAIGAKSMAIRSPTLLNVAWIPVLGWDGKFRNLESVFFGPILNPANMDRKEPDLLDSLAAINGYHDAFAAAFPQDGGGVTRPHIEQALATFVRTIRSTRAPFDRWVEGEEGAISESAKRGFDLFNGKAGCAECHSGWNFTDAGFYDIGSAKGDDIGRAAVFKNSPKLKYAFKVPSLRDVARRGPFMHDGAEPTLEAVIDLYDRGGIDRPSRSELIKPLHLTPQEKSDLIAFLETLTGQPKPFQVPVVPR